MVVPVGILDDHLDLRVHGLGRAHHEVLPGFLEQVQAVLGPAAVALGLDLHVLLAGGEEEVVQQELVEVLGRVLRDAAHHRPVLRVGIAEGLEFVGLVDGVGDAAGHLDALLPEESLGLLEGLVIHDQQVAVRLQVDLVHVQLVGDELPGGFQPGRILHLLHLIGAYIYGNGEILVVRPARNGEGEQQRQGDCGDACEESFHLFRLIGVPKDTKKTGH